ncbi:MAG TPA: SCO family protein [Pseudogracilibacillus sp.]|nr:SCO family protein [Pseudogracilibacillus sp.]
MTKKHYIIAAIIVALGIAAGVYYLEVYRPGTAELPDDVIMETAFGEQYDFGDRPKKARLIEFMYTRCPDVCPVTTLELSKLRNDLEKEGVFGDKVEFITITIDPERDTKEILEDYASRFEVDSPDDGWVFLRGTEENTKKVADALDFLYRDPGSGEIIHSTYTYFMDENDNLLEKFTMGEAFDRERAFKRIMRTIN